MNTAEPLPDVLTVAEISDYLRVSATTVWRWCSTGKLPAFRIGRSWRVRRNDLNQYINHSVTTMIETDAGEPQNLDLEHPAGS